MTRVATNHQQAALSPYQQAKANLGGHVKGLADLTRDNPSERDRAVLLNSQVDDELAILERAIELRESDHAIVVRPEIVEQSRHAFGTMRNTVNAMLADITSMTFMMLRLSHLMDERKVTMPMISLAKMHCARRARAILGEARDILGGNGIVLDYHVARHLADIEAIYTYEGTDTVQSLIIGRDITGQNAFVPTPPPARHQ